MIYTEIALAVGTWALVGVTIWMARRQSNDIRSNLRARFQVEYIDRFDGAKMISARKKLAGRLLADAPRGQIDETVMDFFEDAGMFLAEKYLDETLIWKTFGFFAVRWWIACESYIRNERTLQNDATLFTDFESLGLRLLKRDAVAGLPKPTPVEIKTFLRDEKTL